MRLEPAARAVALIGITAVVPALMSCAAHRPEVRVISMPVHTAATYPEADRLRLKVALHLPEELRKATWNVDYLGTISLGMQLARSAESLARHVFSEVVVTQEAAAVPADAVDAVLTPRLAYSTQLSPPLFSTVVRSQVVLAIGLEWTLRTSNGVIVWADTVRGEFSDSFLSTEGRTHRDALRASAEGRVRGVIDSVFRESFHSLSSAPAIKKFSLKNPVE
jgi:hypothetical protein